VWGVPLWVSFKYRLLFFDASPGSLLSVVSVLWGAYVIWGTAIAQKVDGCDVHWEPGAAITVLVAALVPVLVARSIRPAVGATCALIVASTYFRHRTTSTCRDVTAIGGICVAVATLIVQELDGLKTLFKLVLTEPGK
jgi:hypothetical protein